MRELIKPLMAAAHQVLWALQLLARVPEHLAGVALIQRVKGVYIATAEGLQQLFEAVRRGFAAPLQRPYRFAQRLYRLAQSRYRFAQRPYRFAQRPYRLAQRP